ncbi:MAG: thermonuclease family protein [Neisseria sp.]|nr:thermonuclease family protein [Neisseria sp.]
MDSSFWYNLLLALLGFFGTQAAEVGIPSWLQPGVDFVKESGRRAAEADAAASFAARVTAVSDGDSIRVTDGNGRVRRVRLAYIDAPELQQAGGVAARDALRQRLTGRQVQVLVFEQDQYRRDVAQVRDNGEDVGLAQIENGHAWHYASYAKRGQNKADYAGYAYAEAVARQQRRGLWQAQNPQAPWAYRKAQRESQQPAGRQTGAAFDALW